MRQIAILQTAANCGKLRQIATQIAIQARSPYVIGILLVRCNYVIRTSSLYIVLVVPSLFLLSKFELHVRSTQLRVFPKPLHSSLDISSNFITHTV